MREIKFRQWINDRFVYWGINIDRATFVGPTSSGTENAGNTIHLQFTGLLDRNGKEIYEGDILSGHSDGNVQVMWLNGSWHCIFNDKSGIGIDEMCLWFGNIATVIGNIYENPELLK